MVLLRFISIAIMSVSLVDTAAGQGATVIFSEPDFPVADSTAVSDSALTRGFAGARHADASQLSEALASPETTLLVMPYGSAYPEAAWASILRYLDRGGDLIVLGGKPFTRAAYRENNRWQLRAPSVAASLELFIQDYQSTPGSQLLRFSANPEIKPELPSFAWKEAYSPVIRLSVTPMSRSEIGATGSEDASLTTLAWGIDGEHRLAAPAMLIDHRHSRFVGGRWIFVACDPIAGTLDSPALLGQLQRLALRQQDRFTLRPRVPLFLPGESLDFNFTAMRAPGSDPGDLLKVTVHTEKGAAQSFTFPADASHAITLPSSAAKGEGLHIVEAALSRDGVPLSIYRTGFWMRDWKYLQSGPKLSVAGDYFTLDGEPMPVVGTTYMGSDVNRQFLAEPNAYVWDQDLRQIHAAGLNMIRSGIWSGWDQLVNPDKSMREETLRAIEALLMTARQYNLPVQFNLFAFLPDIFGGDHAYLDPSARQLQDVYVASVVRRFHDVPSLAWDLINEPSANVNAWKTLPQHEPFEEAAWRRWLNERYPDRAALLASWSEPAFGMGRALQAAPSAMPPEIAAADPLAMPSAGAFDPDGVRGGANPLKVYDYFLFTQQMFTDWVRHQRATIHAAGSDQLVTVGQDEGGVSGRVSPAFYSPEISFTTTHTWWDFDSVLWAALAAKMPGEPMLIQEMGEQRRLTQDAHLRLNPEQEGAQLERKLASSFALGAGGIEWVWNVNATMANDNETPIGAIRPDGTEKPEARVLAGFAQFARRSPRSFSGMEAPPVTIVTSQSLLYTGMNALAVQAQKKSLRALTYYDHIPTSLLPENRLAAMGSPKLVILPGAQALTETAWQQLLAYVARGGCLLVTGPLQYDEHWQTVDRLTPLGVRAHSDALALRQSTLRLPGDDQTYAVTYPPGVQQAPLDILRFGDGQSTQVIQYKGGKLIWAADPVEYSEEYESTAALYSYVARLAGVSLPFRQIKPLSPGVLAFPTTLKHTILYDFVSESFDNEEIDIQDVETKSRLHLALRSGHSSLVLLDRATGAVLASYGLEAVP